MAGSRTIEHSTTVRAPASEVVEALTSAAVLPKWFPTEAQSEPKEGGKFKLTFRGPDGNVMHVTEGKYTAVGNRGVSYTWPMDGGMGMTTVDWTLSESGGQTNVKLVHKGFGTGGQWDEVYGMMNPGWQMFVNNLKSVLEGGADIRPKAG